ncbi:universal stress protein [Defluviimonas sp. 20V17]|uniref:Universal stress protein n=1 Tax=Allgaiera indica TaxID=765699 RepID=A0AAN4UNY6_9RHOB|nr:universal stress protein [Allgaiera indica]KDB01803.1 universal stress protein [Defluviimonas sp. 20V17]GHD98897.1 universal stress protein [Allgaiera indica]SDW03904.1 Universal stress protein family protein [Allgaiera indica]
MSYKTLLTVLTSPDGAEGTLAAATAIAHRERAHLEVLCLGIDRTHAGYYEAGVNMMLQQEMIDRAKADAQDLTKKTRAILSGETIGWSVEAGVAQIGGVGTTVALHARFADLVVLPPPYGPGRGPEDEATIEAALFAGQAPVLVVPASGLREGFGRHIVAAWNQSNESLIAVRRALPLLIEADVVNIAIVDPPQHGPERSDPGGLLSQMLARHGVKVEVSVLAKTLPLVSEVLKRHLRDQNADLLVMGAYGHSRLREAILGGATRAMLEGAELPVFMAH